MNHLGEVRHVVDAAEEVRRLDDDGRRFVADLRGDCVAVGQAFPAGRFDQLDTQVARVGADHLSVDRVDRIVHDDLVSPRDAKRHHDGFVHGRAAVIQRRVGDFHAGQAADGGLEFVDGLQRALGDFRLVGRVGGIELASGDQGIECGGDEVVIEPAAEEAGLSGDVFVGQGGDVPTNLLLARAVGQVEFVALKLPRDVREQLVDGIDADGLEHLALLGRCVGDEGHQCSSSLSNFS